MAKKDCKATNGYEAVTSLDFQCTATIAVDSLEVLGTLFSTIARLTNDVEIQALCRHGTATAGTEADNIGYLLERSEHAGMVACKAALEGGAT